jgi:hypothetical protein
MYYTLVMSDFHINQSHVSALHCLYTNLTSSGSGGPPDSGGSFHLPYLSNAPPTYSRAWFMLFEQPYPVTLDLQSAYAKALQVGACECWLRECRRNKRRFV